MSRLLLLLELALILSSCNSYSVIRSVVSHCDGNIPVYFANELTLYADQVYHMQNPCKVQVTASSLSGETNVGVRITLLKFNIPCDEGSLKISNIKTGYRTICGNSARNDFFKYYDTIATFEFKRNANLSTYTSTFDILVTKVNNGLCRSDEFMCHNGDCVDKDLLVCDGNNNCGDNSDESPIICFWTVGVIAGVTIGSYGFVALVVMCFVVVACRRKRVGRAVYGTAPPMSTPILSQARAQPSYTEPQYQATASPPPSVSDQNK